ncbi:hypothetical protein GPNCGGLF_LOCUS3068 [Methylorubrum aminovorans]
MDFMYGRLLDGRLFRVLKADDCHNREAHSLTLWWYVPSLGRRRLPD